MRSGSALQGVIPETIRRATSPMDSKVSFRLSSFMSKVLTRRILEMSRKVLEKPMSDAAYSENYRQAVERLVEAEHHRVGSRMRAYEEVAAAIGKSADWVSRFVSRRLTLDPVAHKITHAYDKLCSRIEADAELRRVRAEKLRGQLHAATSSTARLALGVAARETNTAATQSHREG